MPNALLTALSTQTAKLLRALRPSVALVRGADGHGAGVLWTADGLIVTNDHVVRGDRAAVELSDGRCLDARVLARDRDNDLALLRVPAHSLPAAPLGDSQSLRVGELIVAVGHPWGVRETATLGIVSATGVGAWTGRTRRDVLQADVALAPGNSGGPLVNVRGEVVGIASMILSPGIALAVPAHIARRFVAAALARTAYKQAV